jgi:uncharacterized protein (TIGR03790 family)
MRRCRWIACLLLLVPLAARAGGGPANVMVVVNGDDAEALAVADHYAVARDLPVGHVCALAGIDPLLTQIDFADYGGLVHDPLVACLDALPHPEEIDYLVVVRGLPYRVALEDGGFYTSLTAMLQVHEATHRLSDDPLAGMPQANNGNAYAWVDNPVYVDGTCQVGDLVIDNPYSGWYVSGCGIVRTYAHPPSFRRATVGQSAWYEFTDNLFVVSRLDGFDYQDARDLVDRAVAADGSFPTADILCMEGADEARGARDPECEFVTRHLEMAGWPGVWLSPHDAALEGREVAAYLTGAASLTGAIDGNTYVPGAVACNLTSTGAAPSNFFCDETGTICPESESQTSIARFVRAGATAAHGTVAEPLNNVFPNAGLLLYYALGYNVGESVLFNQRYVYWQNLLLGDPLTTPYAQRPTVVIADDHVPQGEALEITADHPDGVAAIRLYADGAIVAEGVGDTLAWTVDRDVDSQWELLAVAFAVNAERSLPGWPEDVQLPQPDVQGWATGALTVDEPLPGDDDDSAGPTDDDDTADDDDDTTPDDDDGGNADGEGGCGCRTVPAIPIPSALVLLALVLMARRRAFLPGR